VDIALHPTSLHDAEMSLLCNHGNNEFRRGCNSKVGRRNSVFRIWNSEGDVIQARLLHTATLDITCIYAVPLKPHLAL
jgi:hypothetical protein